MGELGNLSTIANGDGSLISVRIIVARLLVVLELPRRSVSSTSNSAFCNEDTYTLHQGLEV